MLKMYWTQLISGNMGDDKQYKHTKQAAGARTLNVSASAACMSERNAAATTQKYLT